MKQILGKHIEKRLAILIMIAGFAIGITAGYWVFWGRNRAAHPQQAHTQWIFSSDYPPLVNPPPGPPAVVPPQGPPPGMPLQ